ncbi:DUF3110 domain-containing protein [Desulfopila inferna]|uniref:DUF3110 domain-containing protein n=1 Tax=Desulfopila inferna TaxID=468528 RepID=UPI001963C2E5|nr:DUF3110 domain-containing protein [Desulfopila inferna]
MTEKASTKGWVYVVVCEPEKEATFLGLHNKEKKIDFIPAFESKDAANDCFLSLPREKGKKYEIQAVHIEELYEDAEKNGFVVAMVDNDGKVIGDDQDD